MEYKDFVSLRDVKRFSKARVIKKIKKLSHDGWGQNALLLQASPVLYMLPHNDGQPTCPFIWYQKIRLGLKKKYVEIIDNNLDFTQIKNIPQILDKTVDIMVESYEKRKAVSPLDDFGVLLTDRIEQNYSGNGEFVFLGSEGVGAKDRNGAHLFFSNVYLDVFIGWNYGDVIRTNDRLEKKLLDFNQRLISDRTRWGEHPTGLEVSCRTYKGGSFVDQIYKFPLK